MHTRLRLVVGQFIDRDIITEKVFPRFREVIASAMKLRNSVAIELILLLLVFVGGHYLWNMVSVMDKARTLARILVCHPSDGTRISWQATGTFSSAGPCFNLSLIRWYFRLFIWARFLWQSSRLELNLIPTHPDRAAGLGFLAVSCAAFMPLLMAHGVWLAGLMANPIFFAGAKLTDFKMEIIAVVTFLLLIVLGPLLVFSPRLMRAKRTGLREYGIIASRYVSEFDRKWVRGGAADDEQLIGSGDIQSLADLGNSFQVIRDMLPFPFRIKDTVIELVVITLIPILPLVLTMIPLEELIMKLFGAAF